MPAKSPPQGGEDMIIIIIIIIVIFPRGYLLRYSLQRHVLCDDSGIQC